MARTIYPELFTNCWPKDYYCYDIERIRALYKKCIATLFENPEKSADYLEKEMLQNPQKYSENILDDANHLCKVQERAFHEYTIIKDMQYRTRLLWICCIFEIWEQNLSHCIVQEFCNAQFQLTDYQKNQLFNGFETFEKLFTANMCQNTAYQCVLTNFPRYKELNELHLLVNAIKHGRGRSLTSLYKDYPKYKIKEASAFAGTTIYTQTLNIVDDDFYRFCDVLTEFWKWLPIHVVITNIDLFQNRFPNESPKRKRKNENEI